jgi:sugar porter (SP) family MFS transporter
LLFGFDIAIITGAGPFLQRQFHLNDWSLGWAFSALLFGCVIGTILAGRWCNRFGRRPVLLGVALLFALTSAGAAAAPTFTWFIVARIAGGLAVGAASLASPMYVAEVSPASLRGRMGSLYQLSIVVGVLISYTINYLLRNLGTASWRWMFLTGVVPSAVFLFLVLTAPESPRYLILSGKAEEALRILEKITNRLSGQREIERVLANAAHESCSWRDLLLPSLRRPLIAGFVLAVLVQLSGINTITDYAPAIFRDAGWNLNQALISTFGLGITNLVFTICAFWMIDRFGRKPLYIVGSSGMAATLVALAAIVHYGHFRGIVILPFILIYLACFAACVGPVFWTLIPEIFPDSLRATAMTVPVVTQWVANAAVVLFFPISFHHIGKMWSFLFLAVMAAAQGLFTWRFMPETKNRPLEEVEQFWQ